MNKLVDELEDRVTFSFDGRRKMREIVRKHMEGKALVPVEPNELEMLERWIAWLEADEKNGYAPPYVVEIANYLRTHGSNLFKAAEGE